MSVIDRKELAPYQKQYKYEFTLEILKLTCETPLACSLKIMWKRNNKSIQTKNAYQVKMGITDIPLKEEKLSNLSTFIYNSLKKQFYGKESELIVIMYFNGSPKKLAYTPIDTRCVLDPSNIRSGKSQIFEANLTPAVKSGSGTITYKLTSVFKQEVLQTQRPSTGAGNPLNVSGYSIQQPYERRYEVPSQDNISLGSHNHTRYSANRRDRDDSSSRRHEYGLISGLRSNISSRYPGNDFDTRSNRKSIDNQANLNRILNEQQKKRSKVEAQLSKNQVELGELKKKISELAIENMNLKNEVKKQTETKDTCDKEQLNALQYKLYEANNELRQLRTQLQNKKRQGEKLESECIRFRMERSNYEQDLSIRQAKIEEVQKNAASSQALQILKNQNGDLKYQLESIRRYLDQVKQQSNDKENQIISQNYRERQDLMSKIEFLQRQNDRMRGNGDVLQELQRKIGDSQDELNRLRNELNNRVRALQQAEQDSDQLRNRLKQLQMERSYSQKDNSRVREAEGQIQWLRSDNTRLKEQSKYYQEQYEESQQQMQKIKLEQSQNDSKNSKLLPQINELQKKLNQAQVEINVLRAESHQLEQQKQNLEGDLNRMKEDMFRSNASASVNPQMDRLLRQSLQMQVELKFAKDQLERLRGLEQAFQGERWRAQKEHNQRVQVEGQFEQTEKELMKKNRALLIQTEKQKVMAQQIQEQRAAASLYKEELQQQQHTFSHLQDQLQQTCDDNRRLNQDIINMEQHINSLKSELERANSAGQQISALQNNYRELEGKYNQKSDALIRNSQIVDALNNQLHQLKSRNQQLHRQLVGRDKLHYDLENRCKELEKLKASWDSQRSRLGQDKRMLEKRNQMVMEEIHTMKKRFEEEKGRSMSYTRNEDSHKVRVLESDLEKKEKTISKLNKEKLQLQQENVKINVQVMKLLSEVEKLKSGNLNYTSSSFKSLGSYK